MSAAPLIERLEGVRQTAPDRWIARCPAHEDRAPSLSIRELPDGRVLVYDFAGCATADILASVGLNLADLFEKPLGHHQGPVAVRNGLSAAELLALVDHEVTVASLLLSDVIKERRIDPSQFERLCLASARVGKARAVTNPLRVNRNAA